MNLRTGLLVLIIFCSPLLSYSQVEPINPGRKTDVFNYNSLENKPLFGGAELYQESEERLREYVQSKIDSLGLEESHKAYVSFVIDTEGKVTNVKVIYGKNNLFNQKAVEIATNLPRWQPASKDDKLVKSSFTLEVRN